MQAATFVGRTKEIDRLKQALGHALSGSGDIWLIGGESGVGKTRLLDEFRAHALVAGWQVITGQAIDGGGAPYQLWADIIPRLLLSIEVSDEVSDFEAAVLRQISPAIDQLFDRQIPNFPNLEGGDAQKKIVDTLLAILQRQSQPILLILEDLQWSREGLYPLKEILRVQPQMKNLFIVGTYRNEERPKLTDELPGAKSILLDRLVEDDVLQLSQAILGEKGGSADIVSLLVQETEGNTFFIIEVLRALAEQAGQLDKVSEMYLPESVSTANMTQILKRRIQQVAAEDFQLLQLAAVAGRQIDQALLHQLFGDTDLNSWLQRISDAAMFTVRNDRWLFAHDKLRETILNDLDPASRQKFHRDVALGLEAIYAGQVVHEANMMEHWRSAGNRAKELEYLPRVISHLFKLLADFEQAIANINRGLQLLPEGDKRRLPLLSWLTDIHVKQGHFDLAAEVAQRELALAKTLDDPAGLANVLINLGFLYINQRRYDETENVLKQCFQLLESEEHQLLLDNVYHALGQVEMLRGNDDQALHYHHQSLELRQRANDQKSIAFSLNNIGEVYYYQGAYEKAKPYFEESLAMRYKHADPHSITYALISLALVQLKLREPEARARLVEALQSALDVNAADLVLKVVLGFAYFYLDFEQQAFDIKVAEIIGLVSDHPSFSSKWDLIVVELQSILGTRLDAQTLTNSVAAGRTRDLEPMIEEILERFSV